MPGSSRMPISLRESISQVKKRTRQTTNPLLVLNLDL